MPSASLCSRLVTSRARLVPIVLVSLTATATSWADEGDAGSNLRAAAGSSPRPEVCQPELVGRAERAYTVWERAREPQLIRYCDALARGYARLGTRPGQALEAAKQAASSAPADVAPALLEARALLALGRVDQAWARFRSALNEYPGLKLTPDALHDYARTAVASGHLMEALSAYRRLVVMAGLLTRPGSLQSAYVEAALVVMLSQPAQLEEAIAYLNEARRRSASPFPRPYILATLALALDLQGRREESRGVANEAGGRTALMINAAEHEGPVPVRIELPRIARVELLAMIGILSEPEDADLAREYWRAFLEQASSSHPWRAYVQSKVSGGR